MTHHRIPFAPALTKLLFLWLLLVAAFVAPALAAAPRSMSYQGVLTDDSGLPLPDATYALTFRLYTTSAGGTSIWTETHPSVLLAKGGFSVVLGAINPLPSGFQFQTYLGVQVGADPELVPRVMLAGAPWSLDLALPWAGIANSTQPAVSLVNSGTGAALELQGRIQVKAEAGGDAGEVQVFSPAYSTAAVKLGSTLHGGNAIGYDEIGHPAWELAADGNTGNGGYLRVFRGVNSANGFIVDGNYSNTNNPHVSILGADRSAIFNMSVPDNNSVVLPNNAIGAAEILDEPGVTSEANSIAVTIDETWETVLTSSLATPAPGFLFGVASAQVNVVHTQGTATTVELGLTGGLNITPTYAPQLSVPSSAPTGTYRFPASLTHMYASAGGTAYMVLKANKLSGGTVTIQDVRVNAVYLPTSYGVVEVLAQPGAAEAAVQTVASPQR